mgnify:CR=1 FL=1
MIIEDLNHYIGKPKSELESFLKDNFHTLRIIKRDGIPMVCTRDVNRDRLNVEVVENLITAIKGFG